MSSTEIFAQPRRLPAALAARPGAITVDARIAYAMVAALAGFAIAAFAPQIFNDGDTYWHISAGQWMLDHGAILRSDPFSYTKFGAAWHTQEWLSEILMALAYRQGEWNGIALLFGVATGGLAGLLAFHLGRWFDRLSLTVVLVLGLSCAAASLLARPHLLALPLLEIWTAGLVIARNRNRTPSYALLPVMTVWANLHGSFMIGLALILPLLLEAVLQAGPNDKRSCLRGWGIFGAGAVLAAAITPFGLDGLLFPFRLMAMGGLAHISEWQAANFATITPLEIAILAGIFVIASRGIRLPLIRLVLLLGLTHLALQHVRHAMILGIAGPLILAEPLARGLNIQSGTGEALRMQRVHPVFAASPAILLAMAICFRIFMPFERADDAVSPGTALAHVPAALQEMPVLNDYAFGGFLIFNGVKPFIDSRADLYGDSFLENYAALIHPDRSALQKTLSHYHIQWTILGRSSPMLTELDAMPGWKRLYSGELAVVHERVAAR